MKNWIDATRAVCMLVIYLFHAYVYCQLFDERLMGRMYVTINVFVVVSGYLFYQNHAAESTRRLSLRNDVRRILERLVWPSTVFATALFVPKMWFNHTEPQWDVFCYNVLGGMTFWFTSALAVAQVFFALLFAMKKPGRGWHVLVVVPFFLLGFWRPGLGDFPWRWTDGLEFTLYFALGGCYFMHEAQANRLVRRHRVVLTVLYGFIAAVYALYPTPWVFMVFNVASFPVAIACIRRVSRPHRAITFVGRSSLVFYLLCGLTPAAFATLLRHTCGIHAWTPWVVFPLSFATSAALTYGLKRCKIRWMRL